jgi:F-type H+-transporting ATPase subunit a
MHRIPRQVLLELPAVWGIDLSITNEVLLLWLAGGLTFVVVALACRRPEPVPRGAFANCFEAIIAFIDQSVIREGIGEGGAAWAPFLLTLFFFILFANLFGLVPLPSHVQAMTANINVPCALAAITFGITVVVSVVRHGIPGFLKKFVPTGIPGWIVPFVVPIEIVSWLARPVSLAIRLFANMMAGHALVLVFIGLAASLVWFAKPLPFVGAVLMSVFELFVASVQAFIFTLLSGIYIKDALESSH